MYIDLSHEFKNNMPGFKMTNEDGSITQYSAKIYPFMTHQQTLPKFEGKASFEITQIEFQSSVGTYIDSPYHRYPKMKDISQLPISDLINEGIIIDVRGMKSWDVVKKNIFDERNISSEDLKDKAVLFNFGWDQFWGTEAYFSYPFISAEVIDFLIDWDVAMVGTDTINIDSSRDFTRPAHSSFLKEEICIVENLCNLDQLYGKSFIIYAVPIKGVKVAAMPIRAFAEVI